MLCFHGRFYSILAGFEGLLKDVLGCDLLSCAALEQFGSGSPPERVVELELHHFLVLFRIFGSELLNFPGFEPELPLESAVLLLILLLC